MNFTKSISLKPRGQKNKSGRTSKKNDNKRFVGKNLLSIDVGQHTIKLVLGRVLKSTVVEVKRTVSFPTPPGSVEKGRIIDIDALSKQIKNMIDTEKPKAAFVLCTLENAEIITREIILPTADEAAMESMLEYEVQQYMPVDLGNYIIQSKTLDSISNGETSKTRFLSTAVPKDLAQSYYDLMQRVNLKASVLDIQSNSIDKLFLSETAAAPESYSENTSIAVIDIGYSHINVILMEDGKYQFNRYIDQGAINIDRSLKSVFNYSEEETDQKKFNDIDLNITASPLTDLYDSSDQVTLREINVVKNVVDSWANELERVFRYYSSRSPGKSVQEILIHGGAAQLKGIDGYLSKVLGIPVERVGALNCIRIQDNSKNITPYLNAIGAFFRH